MKNGTFNHIEAIRDEYRRIDGKWLRMQYHLMLSLVAVTTVVETAMYFVLQKMGTVSASPQIYLLKYLLVPFACNLLLCGAATLAVCSRCLTDRRKTYVVSLTLAVMAFVIYTVHAVFHTLFLIFTIPMILTVVYGDLLLTGVTSLACIVGKAASDLFLVWDPDRSNVLSTSDSTADFALSLLLLLVFCGICCFLIRIEKEKHGVSIDLERERQRYQEESMTDALTKVWNRQALQKAFQSIELQAGGRFYLAMLDLDDFKSLNDTYGHARGDGYLQVMGEALRAVATEYVTPFRFGGDEFCILFCDCSQEEVCTICREIQNRFAQAETDRNRQPVSVSMGVALYKPGEQTEELVNRADAALYRAKQQKGSVRFAP